MSDLVRVWLDHTHKLDQEARPGPWENYDGTVGNTFWNEGEPDFEPLSYTHIMARADAEWIAHARQALPAATAAIWAVLDQHAPLQSDTSDLSVCEECDRAAEWPCPTVQAMTAALTSHQHPTQGGEQW